MAQFISVRGRFFPALEEVALTYNGKTEIPKEKLSKNITIAGEVLKPGGSYIYKGPDREAMYILHKEGVQFLGEDFEHDPEFLQKVRAMNFNSIEDYLKFIGYDKSKDLARTEKLLQEVNTDREVTREEESYLLAAGGGVDKTGKSENDIVGGFGEARIRSKSELKAK
jgi:hypothetical protein